MLPLTGVRILDLSRLLPGPACSWYLYGLGAEVIKVEDPAGGDYLRHVPPFREDGQSAWFVALNAGKRSVALDLKRPAHRAALRGLLTTADVLLEGFRPGVLARLGLDPAELVASYPRLIVASLTGYGQTGPLAGHPGHDLNYCGLAGVLDLGQRQDGVPPVPGLQVADLAGGALTTALAIAAALVARATTGRGQWLDLSMTEGAMALGLTALAAAQVGSPPVPGAEPLTGGLGSYGVYRCADGGLVSFAALEPKFWVAFCALVGHEPAMDRAALAPIFAQRSAAEWVALGAEACIAPVLAPGEVPQHPQHVARQVFVGPDQRLRPPFPGARVGEHAPALGEHTEAELRAVGVPPQEITP